jgi:hypothetical protein
MRFAGAALRNLIVRSGSYYILLQNKRNYLLFANFSARGLLLNLALNVLYLTSLHVSRTMNKNSTAGISALDWCS